MTGNSEHVRQINADLIRNILRENTSITKAEIAKKSGLSYATCSNIINKMVKSGEIIVLEEELINSGRPAHQYQYNENFSQILCVILEHHKQYDEIKYAIYTLLGKTLKEDTIKIQKVNQVVIETLIHSQLDLYPAINMIAIGIPGVVYDYKEIGICDMPSLKGLPLAQQLKNTFRIPVFLVNDMNCTALGYYKSLHPSTVSSLAALIFSKDNDPGSGIIINGEILHGHSNFAGEISFLPSDHNSYNEFSKENRNLPFGATDKRKIPLDKKTLIELIANSISSISAIVDPGIVLISCSDIEPEDIEVICEICRKWIPPKHIPSIRLKSSTDHYYLLGLLSMSLERLEYPVKMVHKSF